MQVIHGESFLISAGPNDTVTWLQEEATARFSREHNFSTHVVQVTGGRRTRRRMPVGVAFCACFLTANSGDLINCFLTDVVAD